jgi:DNA-binding transcriptional MerR regulator
MTFAENHNGLRIDDLAALSKVSVRNIREYQDRGLLPPPRRDGRIAYYGEEHVLRLRLISRLLNRGYTLAVIRDLLTAWSSGLELSALLGLETESNGPWTHEDRVDLTKEELDDTFGRPLQQTHMDKLIDTGVVIPNGSMFRCSRSKVVATMPILLAAGVPIDDALEVLVRIRRHMDAVAYDMADLVTDVLIPEANEEDVDSLTSMMERLRIVAEVVARGLFGLAIDQVTEEVVEQATERFRASHENTT